MWSSCRILFRKLSKKGNKTCGWRDGTTSCHQPSMGTPLPVLRGELVCRTKTPRCGRENRTAENYYHYIREVLELEWRRGSTSSRKRCPPSIISRAPNPGRVTRRQLARAYGIRKKARNQSAAIKLITWACDLRDARVMCCGERGRKSVHARTQDNSEFRNDVECESRAANGGFCGKMSAAYDIVKSLTSRSHESHKFANRLVLLKRII